MSSDVTYAISGDRALLTSPPVELKEPGCLTFDYRLHGNMELQVYMQYPGYLQEVTLCDLWRTADWENLQLPLPAGSYSLVFQATLSGHSGSSYVKLDNVMVLNEKCIDDALFGKFLLFPNCRLLIEGATANSQVFTNYSQD